MDLIEAIVDHYDNGTEAEAVALRALVGVDKLCADQDLTNAGRPYIVVTETWGDVVSTCFDQLYRVESVLVQFNVFADSRSEVLSVLDALEDCYLSKLLTTTGRVVMGKPVLEQRLTVNEIDDYKGILQLSYLLQKNAG